ncbi:MAG: flagellar hook assembly protein FlgD [Pseudomonadota bacterium]
MNSRIGANSFPQRAQNIREKTSGVQTTDPLAMKKEFGDKNLGDILNQVADPNFKASKRKVKGVGNAELGKDAFFKLMLTQLKQQDPTNPLKSHEMAAQLAQFSSVEQLSNMNETLTKMSQKGGEENKFDVLNLIGKKVSGDSSRIDRIKGDREHKVEFTLPKESEKVTVSIKDGKGIVVKKYELTQMKKGAGWQVFGRRAGQGVQSEVLPPSARAYAMRRWPRSADQAFRPPALLRYARPRRPDGVQLRTRRAAQEVHFRRQSIRRK